MSTRPLNELNVGFCDVDPMVWKGFAGPSDTIPSVGETVCYFPWIHAEHATSFPIIPISVYQSPPAMIVSRVLNVKFLANTSNEQIFAAIELLPISEDKIVPCCGKIEGSSSSIAGMFVSFTVKLEMNDMIMEGRLVLPNRFAELVFPHLNCGDKQPILIRDVLGNNWVFCHEYNRLTGQHMLTKGWSIFGKARMLIAGDSITFMKNKITHEYYIGISRGCLTKFSPELIVKAVDLAAANMPFEVIYYPPILASQFLINYHFYHLSHQPLMLHHDESVKQDDQHTDNSSSPSPSSFRLFGKNINVKNPDI